jgi:hypothetical protein
MTEITNEFMQSMLAGSKQYSIAILRPGPNSNIPERQQIVWEHGRRNFQLRAEGLLSVVCPIMNNEHINGIGIFNVDENRLKEIMEEDPGVKKGVFTYEILSGRSFPGDSLP